MIESSISIDQIVAVYNSVGDSDRKIKALNNVSIKIAKGDRVGVIGANGSGKSTLLKVLGGSMPPSKGKVTIEGETLTLLNRKAGLIYRATLKENALIKGASLGLKSDELKEFVETCLHSSYLLDRQNDALNSLSTGMTGRFNLVLNSQIVKPITILDEWIGTLEMAQLGRDSIFHRLVNETDILVVASHNETLIRKVCNKVILLDRGGLVYYGDDFGYAFSELDKLKSTNRFSDSTGGQTRSQTSKVPVHFIHPGKTGGYIVKKILQNSESDKYEFVLHSIHTTVTDVPKGEKIIFFSRTHQERFCRAFLNRKNKGAPFYSTDWTERERWAFSRYSEPNDLAEDLSSENLIKRFDAFRIMAMINFVESPLLQHFGSVADLQKRQDDILYIGDADDLFSSLRLMLNYLSMDESLLDQIDPEVVSYFSNRYESTLSEQAQSNLSNYYHMDIEINQYFNAWRKKNFTPE